MAIFNPYLNFNGNTEEAFHFYKSVFGGDFTMVMRMKDIKGVPGCENLPANDQDKIMHIALPIGKGNVLMGTDVIESMGQPKVSGNNFSISIHVDTDAEADKLFAGLSDGANVIMPLGKVFWGDYYGMLVDKFGIQWMVSHHYEQAA